MGYSVFVDAPKAYAAAGDPKLQHEGEYFFYEDHIGRPAAMSSYDDTDSNGFDLDGTDNYYWKAFYMPFGQVHDDMNSAGITVGTSPDDITWLPPFRFPGQYEDPEPGGRPKKK